MPTHWKKVVKTRGCWLVIFCLSGLSLFVGFERDSSYIGGFSCGISASTHLSPLLVSDPSINCDNNKSEYFDQKSCLIKSILLLFIGLAGIIVGWWHVRFGRGAIWPWFVVTLLGMVALFFGLDVILL